MTDRQHPPPRAGSQGSSGIYSSPEPEPVGEIEEPKKFKLPVNVVQVSASAGAAVTSAVAASYFGVGGTLAGAAFGSVVSSVAGAFYTESLTKAHKTVQTATAVVVQRYPGDVPQADSIRRMTGPAGVPVADSLNRVGGEDGRHTEVEHVEVPIVDETQVMGRPYDDETQVMPPVSGGMGFRPNPPAGPSAQHRSSGEQPASRSERRQAEQTRQTEQTWWKKPGFVMAGISMAGFLIALVFITGLETGIGRPISGGDGGTSISRLSSNTSSDSGSDEDSDDEGTTPTPTSTETATETATPTDTASPTATSSETVAPTESAAPQDTATSEPTATDTVPSTGSDEVAPSEQSQDSSEQGDTLQGDTGTDGQVQEQSAP